MALSRTHVQIGNANKQRLASCLLDVKIECASSILSFFLTGKLPIIICFFTGLNPVPGSHTVSDLKKKQVSRP